MILTRVLSRPPLYNTLNPWITLYHTSTQLLYNDGTESYEIKHKRVPSEKSYGYLWKYKPVTVVFKDKDGDGDKDRYRDLVSDLDLEMEMEMKMETETEMEMELSLIHI